MSDKEIQNHDEGIRLYELGFNLVSSLPEEELDKEFNNLKQIITKNAKEIVKESDPTLIDLAYTISKNIESKNYKYDTAYFGWVKFNAEAEALEKIKEELDLFQPMLRYLLIKATEGGEITSEEVSQTIKGKEYKDPNEDDSDDSEDSEDTDTDTDASDDDKEEKDSKIDEEKVDKAIDELVK